MAPKSPAGFLYNFIGRNIADPTNYRFLQEAAGDVLSRAIPKNVNWGGLPTQFLNTLSDITKMAPGAAKEAARTKAKTTLVRAAVTPPARVAGQVTSGGALRAPSIGSSPAKPPVMGAAPSTPLPGGGPFNIDYALRRSLGLTGNPQQVAGKLGLFPLDNPLNRAMAQGRYLQRQLGTGFQNVLGAGGDLLKRAQDIPFITKTPTTRLGKVGQVLNPLNPANLVDLVNPAPGIGLGARLASGLGLTGAAGLGTSVAGGLAGFGAFEALFPQSLADGTLEGAKLPKRGPAMFADAFPFGGDASIRDKEGRVWAGRNYGFQSPESFRKLYGANVGIAPGSLQPPEAPAPPVLLDPGLQAGQLTPPAPPPGVPPGVVSNGAGAPAQRQNVQERQISQDVLNAAQQYATPTGVPLSSFYAGQQQLGRSMEQGGELQRRLKELGGAAGMTDEALMQWAQANPGLAYRELLKRQVR